MRPEEKDESLARFPIELPCQNFCRTSVFMSGVKEQRETLTSDFLGHKEAGKFIYEKLPRPLKARRGTISAEPERV